MSNLPARTTTTTKTNYYTSDGDRPAWTDEAGSTWTRVVAGAGGTAAVTSTFGVTNTEWQLANLHGDIVATVNNSNWGVGAATLGAFAGEFESISALTVTCITAVVARYWN
ncbi:hypothetical protein AB0K00_29905 [Dactylosporangium sp. NPDC049525]|uniref:hypothetical protein n=1 Tax=Dactylosporangium sp. NPDC049525 TaxID=3154730 RepID=UPI003449F46F